MISIDRALSRAIEFVPRGRAVAAALTAITLSLVLAIPAMAADGRDHTLRLAEFAFDPVVAEPELPAGWDRSSSTRQDLHLVQFDGPVTDELLARLRAEGLDPVQYVHPDTYMVWGHRHTRQKLNGQEKIRWTGDFAPAYRVLPQWRKLSRERVDLQVLMVRGAADAAIAALASLGAELSGRRAVNPRLEIVHVSLAGDRIPAGASVEGVVSIQASPSDWGPRGEATAQINAGNVGGGNLPVPGYPGWLSGLGLDGSGVTVGHVDEGVDAAHPDLASRVISCTGPTCSSVISVHGTHTAGIIAGDGTTAVIDPNGFLRGHGVAPGASLVEQVYYPTLLEPAGMRELMRETWANGGSVSSNSWGRSNLRLGYDMNAMMVDAGVRDVDPDQPGDQSLTYVQAIANGSGGTSTQGVPDDAKNIFTVGATIGIDGDGSLNAGYDDLAGITAHGPALDGRTIPHMVAPGCYVDSTLPYGEGTDFGPQCGTSMAAPQVAGAVALFIEYYRGLAGTSGDPSPALVKSAFLPVAHDLQGSRDADGLAMGHRPDSKQGWGRLNLAAVIDPPAGSVLYFDQTEVFDFTGQEWERVVRPVDPAQPMRIMLAWTDAPGHGLGGSTPAWNNDLDLAVEVGASTYLGNVFGSGGFSVTGGVADEKNNAEGVFLQGLSAGTEVTLRVGATNINSDALPNSGDGTDQDFALTCYNCELVSSFALTASPTVEDVCAPADATYLIDVEQLAGYTTPVTLSVTGVPADASVAFDVNPVGPGGSSQLTIGNTGSVTTGDYTLTVQGDTVDWTRSRLVELRVRGASPAPALLTAPSNGAIDVDPLPLLAWDPSSWADEYLVEISTDATFQEIVYSAVSETTSHTPRHLLKQAATYFWRVRATNACGYGAFSAVSSFTTVDVPDVLLVDDDGSQSSGPVPDVQVDYTNALDTMGTLYDIWDVWESHNGDEPDAMTLSRYERIIWFTGEEEIYAGPDTSTETAIGDWLDRAGCLLISSADYILNGEFDQFVQDRFGVASVVEDSGQNTVTGQGAVFTGLGPYTLKNDNTDYSDTLNPDATAEVGYGGDVGNAAVDKDAGYYRTSFAGFGFERFSSASNGMQDSLTAFLNWCVSLPAVDGDSDGVANGLDCVAGDAGVWTAPGEIDDLMVSKTGYSWTEPVSGSGAEYDVLRSDTPLDFYNATCVATGRKTTSASVDPGVDPEPAAGHVVYYLARARNECGQSSIGQNQDGSPRHGNACE